MKIIKNTLLIIVLFLFSCKEETTSIETKTDDIKISKKIEKSNLNISILLDLSDRINPKKYPNLSMEYYERDLGYITAIAKAFEKHMLTKKTREINDKIQLFVDPEPLDKALNSKIATLKKQFNKHNATKEYIGETADTYTTICREIYEKAIADGKFIGSDIFGFFKNKITNYCIDNDYRNIVFILTDGYMFHKDYRIRDKNKTSYLTPKTIKNFRLNTNSWQTKFEKGSYGFLPIHQNVENLEVLVLGINPSKNNPHENDVLDAYWNKWLLEMNVKNYEIKSADLPTHLEDVIRNFINE